MSRRTGPPTVRPGVVIAALVVLASILAPWLVIQMTEGDQAPPPSARVATPTVQATATVATAAVQVASNVLGQPAEAGTDAAQPTEAPASTAAPSPTPSETDLPTATVTATPSATPSPTPSRTPAPTPTNTSTATATWTATASPVPVVVLKAPPTATFTPRPTARPTRRVTRTPTRPPPQPPPAGGSGPPPSAYVSPPAPSSPGQNEYVNGTVHFSWVPTGPLPDGGGYEVVWWNSDETPAAARGFAAATTGTSIDVNLDSLYQASRLTGSQIFWTVLVVRMSPYQRWTQPAGSERSSFFYAAPGGGPPPEVPPPPKPRE